VATLLADARTGSAFPTVVSMAPPRTLGDVGYVVLEADAQHGKYLLEQAEKYFFGEGVGNPEGFRPH